MDDTLKLSVWDYVLFGAMLVISAGIGVYSAFSGDRQRTADEYLLGNRNMHVVPVALSMMVSFVSAISVLGTPAEMYVFNTMFWWNIVGYALGAFIATQMFVPMFMKLRVTSIFEYLELRFNRTVRLFNMFVFFFQMNFYMGIVIYTPALALNAATGMSLSASILSTGAVCIFYTTIGGMKAVLWTDAFQTFVMAAGVIAVIIVGCIEVGGLDEVWRIASEGGRIVFFDMRADLTIRNSFWTVNIGSSMITVCTFGMNQAIVQRCLSLGSLKKARWAIFLAVMSQWVVVSLMCLSGVVMYAYYKDCDPFTSGKVHSPDQLMPYMVMEVFSDMPGIPGIFLASVLSASLSTLSSGVNALAAVTGEDACKMIWPDLGGKKYAAVTKLLSLFYGLLAIAVAFLAKLMGDHVLSMGLSIFGITYGSVVATFVLGVCFPRVNSKGVLIGTFVSIGIMLWLKLGNLLMENPPSSRLPLSTDGCPADGVENSTYVDYYTTQIIQTEIGYTEFGSHQSEEHVTRSPLDNFYSLSYLMYGPFGFLITMVAAVFFSGVTGFQDPNSVDKRLLINFGDMLCCFLPPGWRKKCNCGEGDDVLDDDIPWAGSRYQEKLDSIGHRLHLQEKNGISEEKDLFLPPDYNAGDYPSKTTTMTKVWTTV
ncbi:sodium-coupled monocarboxylate transporter 1-like [Diadema antillarum]|uniref:sodium-coupled monocarboxylate transporter 1-like n=1 Tax=Diadema antillarum TaxID=105358 RepID=UPI003A8B44ED